MILSTSSRKGFLDTILNWIDRSLWLNWLGIPVAIGLTFGYVSIADYNNIFIEYGKMTPVYKTGYLTYADLRHRRLILTTSDGRLSVWCGADFEGTTCLPGGQSLPQPVRAKLFPYSESLLLISAVTVSGDTLVAESDQRNRFRLLSIQAALRTRIGDFVFGAVLGIPASLIRYVFSTRRFRRKASLEVTQVSTSGSS